MAEYFNPCENNGLTDMCKNSECENDENNEDPITLDLIEKGYCAGKKCMDLKSILGEIARHPEKKFINPTNRLETNINLNNECNYEIKKYLYKFNEKGKKECVSPTGKKNMYQVPEADVNLQVVDILDHKRVKVKVVNTNQSLDGHIFECSVDNLEQVQLLEGGADMMLGVPNTYSSLYRPGNNSTCPPPQNAVLSQYQGTLQNQGPFKINVQSHIGGSDMMLDVPNTYSSLYRPGNNSTCPPPENAVLSQYQGTLQNQGPFKINVQNGGRKSPEVSATKHPGEKMKGLDGNMWESRKSGKSYRWFPVKKSNASKKKTAPPKKKPVVTKKKTAPKKTSDNRISASEYYKEFGEEAIGDIVDIRNNRELKCLLKRSNGTVYWASQSKSGKGQEQCGQGMLVNKKNWVPIHPAVYKGQHLKY